MAAPMTVGAALDDWLQALRDLAVAQRALEADMREAFPLAFTPEVDL